VTVTEVMMRRYLASSAAFLERGFTEPDEWRKQAFWERSTLAGMCAYLLHALHTVDPGEAAIVCSFLVDADRDGQDLAVWVDELRAARDADASTSDSAAVSTDG
jgi:hypothetical protein